MSLFVFKPHVCGEQGVTTPDLIVDRVALRQQWVGVQNVSAALEFDSEAITQPRAAVVLCAAGGGTLLSPALVFDAVRVSVARKAYRWADAVEKVSSMTLNDSPLCEYFKRSEELAFAGFSEGNLPRGRMLVLPGDPVKENEVGRLSVVLKNDLNQQNLTHHVSSMSHAPLADEANGNAAASRYAIGPTQQSVEHYNIIKPV